MHIGGDCTRCDDDGVGGREGGIRKMARGRREGGVLVGCKGLMIQGAKSMAKKSLITHSGGIFEGPVKS